MSAMKARVALQPFAPEEREVPQPRRGARARLRRAIDSQDAMAFAQRRE